MQRRGATYDLGYTERLAAGPPGALPFTFTAYAGEPLDLPISTATFGSPSVAVPAGGSATVNVNIAVDPFFTALGRTLWGGWITLTPQGGDQVYRVPVVAFAGDYQAIVHMPTIDLGGGFQIPSISDATSTCCRVTRAARGISPVRTTFRKREPEQRLPVPVGRDEDA